MLKTVRYSVVSPSHRRGSWRTDRQRKETTVYATDIGSKQVLSLQVYVRFRQILPKTPLPRQGVISAQALQACHRLPIRVSQPVTDAIFGFMRFVALLFLLFSTITPGFGWGFHAHRQINRLAVFGLPPEMIGFYKHHLGYLTENAVNPDRRRYAVEGEAQRHYIDLDVYGDSAAYKLPRNWNDAVARFTEDTLQAYGIAPWWIMRVKFQLTEAFVQRDARRILSLSADLGHYIGDLNVPLHTTANYNGQLTGQHGIHGLWEGRIPELFATDYDFWLGQAQYLYQPQQRVWQALAQAHNAVDSVLRFEQILSKRFPADKKYSFEQRGAVTQRVYSRAYVDAYHRMLGGQVERQMRAAVRMVRDFWFTCWVDAGQPDLAPLAGFAFDAAEADSLERMKKAWENGFFRRVRPHDASFRDGSFGIPADCGTSLPLCRRRFGQILPKKVDDERKTTNEPRSTEERSIAEQIALSRHSIKLFPNSPVLFTFA